MGDVGQVSAPGGDPDGDALSGRLTDFDTGNPVRRRDRESRFQWMVIAALVMTNAVLATAIADLIPLRRWLPYLVQSEPLSSQVVEVRPLRVGSGPARQVAEIEAMRYVRMRHEVIPDVDTMRHRWDTSCLKGEIAVNDRDCAYVSRHSTTEVYKAFTQDNIQDVRKLIERRVTRKVDITLAPIDKGNGVMEVRFVLRDYTSGAAGEPGLRRQRRLVATLWTRFAEIEVDRDERYLNPFGFQVYKYELAEVQRNPNRRGAAR